MKKRIIATPNKPLPLRLSKEYWETSAKLILERFFPERFVNLSVDSESPDLQSAKVGIEVTSTENEESKEIDSLYCHQFAYGNAEQKGKALKRIEELSGRAEKYFLAHPGRSRDLGRIYDRVKTKTRKLNTNYGIFPENDLFIYDSCLILDQELSEVLSAITESSAGYAIRFDSVFLYCFGGGLYEFNLQNKTYTHIDNVDRIIQQLMIDARHTINKKYKE